MSRFFKHLPNNFTRACGVAALLLMAACTMPGRQTVNTPPPPPPPPASAQPSVYQVTFAPGSYEINPAGQRAIEDVSSVVDSNPNALVTVVGRTDASGSADYNMKLSQKRAAAVRDDLISLGKIPAARVDTAWTGEVKQIVGTYNGVADARNRVVDIYIH
jgi:outer membrane protein OmpA-like peptidoglycan-associated protein